MKVQLKRINDAFQFSATGASGVSARLDAASVIGGTDDGIRPMEMILMGLASCSAFDVVHILKKQRQGLKDLDIEVDGKRREEIPKVFTDIHMTFLMSGELDPHKVERAIALSVEKYCSVYEMLKSTVNITWSVEINSKEV